MTGVQVHLGLLLLSLAVAVALGMERLEDLVVLVVAVVDQAEQLVLQVQEHQDKDLLVEQVLLVLIHILVSVVAEPTQLDKLKVVQCLMVVQVNNG
jgi:hypothetical protein